ncbi:MAG: 30S ribosomal protein S6 [Pseudomonadota bacterium]
MRAYETVFIADADISEEDVDYITERVSGIVRDFNGKLLKIEKWGRKKLAYAVKKRTKGYYFLLSFLGDHTLTTELERILKLDDRILKYLTVKVDKHTELDAEEEEKPKGEEAKKEQDTEEGAVQEEK